MALDFGLSGLHQRSLLQRRPAASDPKAAGQASITAMPLSTETAILVLLIATLSIATLNDFFDTYRIAVFKAESYDDYARYLLWFLGEPDAKLPTSPFVYRIGSVAFAAPFYHLPLVTLNGGSAADVLPTASLQYLKATQAMCAANAFAVLASCVITFLYCRRRLNLTPEWSFIGAVLLFVLSRYLGLVAADGIALLPMTLIVLAVFERRLIPFVLVVLLGVMVNEKVAIVATLFVAGRLALSQEDRFFHLASLIVAMAAVVGVFVTAGMLQFPGAEYQRDPSTYLGSALNMLRNLFTPKGAYRNLLLPAALTALWLVAIRMPRHRRVTQTADLGVLLGMMAIGFAVDVKYNLGRICAFTVPIFVIGAVQALSDLRSRRGPDGDLGHGPADEPDNRPMQ